MAPPRLLLIAGCLLGALYAVGLFYEADLSPAGCCGLTWPTPDPMAAERRMAHDDPQALNAAVQRQAAVEVLTARPAEPTAWLRLAYADRLAHTQLTPAGAKALETSYLVSPFIYRQAPWRIGFAFDNWSRLTPEGRRAALREIEIARNSWLWIEIVAAIRRGPADPSGRMAAALLGLS